LALTEQARWDALAGVERFFWDVDRQFAQENGVVAAPANRNQDALARAVVTAVRPYMSERFARWLTVLTDGDAWDLATLLALQYARDFHIPLAPGLVEATLTAFVAEARTLWGRYGYAEDIIEGILRPPRILEVPGATTRLWARGVLYRMRDKLPREVFANADQDGRAGFHELALVKVLEAEPLALDPEELQTLTAIIYAWPDQKQRNCALQTIPGDVESLTRRIAATLTTDLSAEQIDDVLYYGYGCGEWELALMYIVGYALKFEKELPPELLPVARRELKDTLILDEIEDHFLERGIYYDD